jgi:uncharacterized protein (DUF934 family)
MRFVDPNHDPWHEVTADDSLVAVPAAEAWSLLSPAQWQAVRASWPAALPVGLIVPNDVDIETIAVDLPRLRLVALQFPKWVDGRAYSQARLLRARFRFAGEIRATGEVLVDMLPLLARSGFSAAVLRADQSPATARRVLGFFAEGHYQGDVIEPRPRFARLGAASTGAPPTAPATAGPVR